MRSTTPSDITTLESLSPPYHSDLSSPHCDSSATSNNKSSEDHKSSTSAQGEQYEIQQASSEVKLQNQSTTTVVNELEQMRRERALPSHVTTPGYKLVIDNIDSTVKPRYMREDAQNESVYTMCKFTQLKTVLISLLFQIALLQVQKTFIASFQRPTITKF